MPGIEPLVQLGTLGGFAFAAGALFLILRAMFDAWRKGELVPRSVYDTEIARLVAENGALRADNRDAVKELGRLADAIERLARQ